MTPEANQISLQMAAENIENFLRGRPIHVVAGPVQPQRSVRFNA